MRHKPKAWTRNVQKRFGEPFLMERPTAMPLGYNSFFDVCFFEVKAVIWRKSGDCFFDFL